MPVSATHKRQDWLAGSVKQETGKLVHSKYEEANRESRLENDMPTFKIELASNSNSCIIKIKKQKFCALLDSGAAVSLIHTRVYKSLKEKPKTEETKCISSTAKRDSIDIDGCASLKYEIGRENKNMNSS